MTLKTNRKIQTPNFLLRLQGEMINRRAQSTGNIIYRGATLPNLASNNQCPQNYYAEEKKLHISIKLHLIVVI